MLENAEKNGAHDGHDGTSNDDDDVDDDANHQGEDEDTSIMLMTAMMRTVITLRCYIFSTDRHTQVGPVWCHPGSTWVAPGSRLHSVQTESDPVSPGLRRVLRG